MYNRALKTLASVDCEDYLNEYTPDNGNFDNNQFSLKLNKKSDVLGHSFSIDMG